MGPLRLMRRITATAGGWAGDNATPWVGDDGSNDPVPATVQAGETGEGQAIAVPPQFGNFPARGLLGFVRVTGADSTRRFDLRLVHAWAKRQSDGTDKLDWRELKGAAALDAGNGEEFTTVPQAMVSSRIAFHLIPQGGNLASGSVVEVWASVF